MGDHLKRVCIIRAASAKGVVPWLQAMNEVVLRSNGRVWRTHPNGHFHTRRIIGEMCPLILFPVLKMARDGLGKVPCVAFPYIKNFVSLSRPDDIRAGLIAKRKKPVRIFHATAKARPVIKPFHGIRCLRHAIQPKARTARYLIQRTGPDTLRCFMASK